MPLLTLDYTLINLTAEGEWVKVKSHLTRRDRNHIQGQAIDMRLEIDPETQQPKFPSGVDIDTGKILNSLDFSIIERAVIAWSFDEPITLENLERLSDEDIDLLKETLGAMYERKSEAVKN